MAAPEREVHHLRTKGDVVLTREVVRAFAVRLGLSLVDQTRVVTAASELARNAVVYGGGGELTVERTTRGGREGMRLTFADRGPGIPDVEAAMRDGFTTGMGLGLGLGGARRLVDEFHIRSAPGEGTTVTIVKWR